MAALIRVREKGQVTLPLEVRRQMELDEGDLLKASVEDGRIVLDVVVKHRDVLVPKSVPYNLDKLVGFVSLGGDAVEDSAKYDE